jgi:ribonucleoside-diphosphate reductase alpha chain
MTQALDRAAHAHSSTPADRAGLRVARRYTRAGVNPLDEVKWDRRRTVITNPDGSVVFQMDDVEVPAAWSQLATDIVVSKYFRKAGLPTPPGHETSVRQVVYRIARTIREWGESQDGYFAAREDADAFEAELTWMLVHQFGAFNSPVWFNCGLWHQYRIGGSGGNFWWDPAARAVQTTHDSYSRPQISACFIQSIDDDLMSIFELARNEARVFKFGSGTGTNFSKLRARMEKLSGGGTSSGLMSFLEVLDKGAGATKSGGTTRRAAKMVVLDLDHPEILDFVRWKVREEKKVAALVAGGYSSDFNGDAYGTVSGQNSNNSVRVPDRFMDAVVNDGSWQTTMRTTGAVHETFRARELWREIAASAWQCADPGVQFDDTIQRWHTCRGTDRIYATNPCSEFVFLDDTACNLASINLMKFLREDGSFDIDGYRHTNRIFFLAQEILVSFASYPTEKIARRSHEFRPLGLGYANLGTLLMMQGLPYDSDGARAYAACVTAIMTGEAYALSAEMAASVGPFTGFAANREPMLEVMRLHQAAARQIDASIAPRDLRTAAIECWDRAVALGSLHGYRNSQASVLAPTGTIGLLMDCDTTGVEPDFALVKFKKLAGGGYFKIANQSVPAALRRLGYDDPAIVRIVRYAVGHGTFEGAPQINRTSLAQKGLTLAEIDRLELALPSMLDVRFAFVRGMLSDETLARLGIGTAEREKPGFQALPALGFTEEQIHQANAYICGNLTVEGAPGLRPEHLPVFDCANRCGPRGTRFIQPLGHVHMMGAVQPFISGAISKTVNLPQDATVGDVEHIYFESWKQGLKAVALYRDGSKLSQPLSTGKAEATETTTETAPPKLLRRRLPKRRHGFTQEARLGGHKVFLRTGEYEDGTLGEIFIDMHKEGAAFRSMMNCFAISVSMGLQYGVPLEDLVDQFVFTRFEPGGRVEGHDNLRACTSVVDYVFRVLGIEYLDRTDLAHIVTEDLKGAPVSSMHATGHPVGKEHRRNGGDGPEADAGAAGMAAPAVHAAPAPAIPAAGAAPGHRRMEPAADSGQDALLSKFSGDAPLCEQCGHITIRNGTCFKCLNCGTSMGCS